MSDDDFVILTGPTVLPTWCLAVEPGAVDFPARCIARRGHTDRHGSATSYMGLPVRPTYWDNEDD